MPSLHGRLAGTYSISNVSLWATHLDEAPIHRRAWVLQERLLARRIIHFGQGQLLWECREHTALEMYPTGLPKISALQSRSRFKSLDPGSPINQQRFASTDRETVAKHLWHHVSKEYSRCLLTYLRDKSVALAGVVKVFEAILEDEYIHGVWKKDLAHQLLWRTQDSMYPPQNRLYKVQRAYALPSWSWLSSDCPLYFRESPPGSSTLQTRNLLFEISQPIAGDIDTLMLKCHLRPAELHLTPYGMFQVNFLTSLGKLEAFRLPDVYLDGMLEDIEKPGDVTRCLILPARISIEVRHTKSESSVMLFESILVKACGAEEGTYKRTGIMRVQDEPKAVETALGGRLGGPENSSKGYDAEKGMYEIALV